MNADQLASAALPASDDDARPMQLDYSIVRAKLAQHIGELTTNVAELETAHAVAVAVQRELAERSVTLEAELEAARARIRELEADRPVDAG